MGNPTELYRMSFYEGGHKVTNYFLDYLNNDWAAKKESLAAQYPYRSNFMLEHFIERRDAWMIVQ